MSNRELIAGGIADFLIFLTKIPDPMIIGASYPRDKLVKALHAWAKERDFNMDNADINSWRNICRNGDMR